MHPRFSKLITNLSRISAVEITDFTDYKNRFKDSLNWLTAEASSSRNLVARF